MGWRRVPHAAGSRPGQFRVLADHGRLLARAVALPQQASRMLVRPSRGPGHRHPVPLHARNRRLAFVPGSFGLDVAFACFRCRPAPRRQGPDFDLKAFVPANDLKAVANNQPVSGTGAFAVSPDVPARNRARCQRPCLEKPCQHEPAIDSQVAGLTGARISFRRRWHGFPVAPQLLSA